MTAVMTERQKAILEKVLRDNSIPHWMEGVISESLSDDEIDELCLLVNAEFLMHGIDKDFEATPYGKEGEDVLDIVNSPRLRRSER